MFNYWLFFGCFILSALSLPAERPKILSPTFAVSLLLALVLVSPYYAWLYTHSAIGLNSAYKLAPTHMSGWHGLVKFTLAVLLFIGPVTLLVRIFFKLAPQASQDLLFRYHCVCLPVILTAIVVYGVKDFQARWLIPVLFAYPILLMARVSLETGWQRAARRYLVLAGLTFLTMLALLAWRSHSPRFQERQATIFQAMAQLQPLCAMPSVLISASYWLLGNLKMRYPAAKLAFKSVTEEPNIAINNAVLACR